MMILTAEEEVPILDFLRSRAPDFPWEEEFSAGKIRVGKYFVGKNYTLSSGDKVIHDPELTIPEPRVNFDYRILYEDDYLAAIDKPVPLPIHPTGTYFHHCLVRRLAREGRPWHTIHRLDNETSGVLILAKKPEYVSPLSRALGDGEKTYLVMAYGIPPRRFTVEMPLGKKPGSMVFRRQGFNPQGKTSITRFRLFRSYPDRNRGGEHRSLLLARPGSGRTHQIRAHLAERGFPVVGDKIYGRDEGLFLQYLREGWGPELEEKLELNRQFLHCRRIRILHPFLKNKAETLEVRAPLPEELRNFILSIS